jgi:hypothetical protein
MTAASLGKAKVAGLLVDKQEVGEPGDFSAAQTKSEIAECLLKQANPGIQITDNMRQAAVTELERHISVLSAIAQSDSGQQH